MPLAVDPGYPCVRITWPPPSVPATEDLYRVHKTGAYEGPDDWTNQYDEELGVIFVDASDPSRVRMFYDGPPKTVQEWVGGVLGRTGTWGPCS